MKPARKLTRSSVRRCNRTAAPLPIESPLRTADATTRGFVITRRKKLRRCSVRCRQRTKPRLQIQAALPTTIAATSDSIDYNDFAGVWPIISVGDKPGANRIVANIIPFLPVGFIGPQDVIVESRLPKAAQFLPGDSGRFDAGGANRSVQAALQPFDPFADRNLGADSKADEQMNVIRHDHVAADTDVMFSCATAIVAERFVDRRRCEQSTPQMGIERHEIQRRIEFLKNAFQARGLSLALQEHGKSYSANLQRPTTMFARANGSPLATADATTRSLVTPRSKKLTRCSVRCHQRTSSGIPR
jgi:hypothetical protein